MSVESSWTQVVNQLMYQTARYFFQPHALPRRPRILTSQEIDAVSAVSQSTGLSITDTVSDLERKLLRLQEKQPTVESNYDELQNELQKVDNDTQQTEMLINDKRALLKSEQAIIKKHKEDVDIISLDLQNNQDAAKLQKLGSELQGSTFNQICPVCQQHVQDSLLVAHSYTATMTIDENIAHLKAQQSMLLFSIDSHTKNVRAIQGSIDELTAILFGLQRLGKSIRNDIYSLGNEVSETVVRKRIENENMISSLRELTVNIEEAKEELTNLSEEWRALLRNKDNLPKKQFSANDIKKRNDLCKFFVANLSEFGYKSYSNIASIRLSEDTYMPMIEEFDMRFDSSASDNIRVIWSYTIALLQDSLLNKGNHPGIIIFDEPDQHSIVIDDMKSLFNKIIELQTDWQVIVGITVRDVDTASAIEALDPSKYRRIIIDDKAFMPVQYEEDSVPDTEQPNTEPEQ